jgi:hypothetical protein
MPRKQIKKPKIKKPIQKGERGRRVPRGVVSKNDMGACKT